MSADICNTICGDLQLKGVETCEDGNTANNDGCSSVCTLEPGWVCDGLIPITCAGICGDGLVVGTEICDDGVLNDNQGCTTNCMSVLPGYSCTSGSTTSPSICVLGCGNSI